MDSFLKNIRPGQSQPYGDEAAHIVTRPKEKKIDTRVWMYCSQRHKTVAHWRKVDVRRVCIGLSSHL